MNWLGKLVAKRVGLTGKALAKFKKGGPVAKGKIKKRAREEDAELVEKATEKTSKRVRANTDPVDHKHVSAGAVRGVMDETMARVYQEMWPSMTVYDEFGNVDIEIKEESHILMLTMVTGNEDYQPRRGLKIREAEIGDTIGFCAEHN